MCHRRPLRRGDQRPRTTGAAAAPFRRYRARGHNLTRLANLYIGALRNAEADALSRRAIALLETLPPGVELARATMARRGQRMLDRDYDDSAHWARKAIAVAETLGERAVVAGARSTLGAG